MHSHGLDPSLAPDRRGPPPIHTYGDTDYYFFETQDLPLFGPLRTLGVPEPVIDVVEPVSRWSWNWAMTAASHRGNPPRRG